MTTGREVAPPSSPMSSSTEDLRKHLAKQDSSHDEWDEGDSSRKKAAKSKRAQTSNTSTAKPPKRTKASSEGGEGSSNGDPAASPGKGAAKAWSAQEKGWLLEAVVKKAHMTAKDFDEVAARTGRTSVQCYDQWRQRLAKKLQEAIASGI